MNLNQTNTKTKTKVIVYCALFVALLVVLAQVAIPLPFSPVALTLGLLGVLVCGTLLGERLGTLSVLIYIVMGLIGLPVFAGFKSAGAITGPTGGYIVGYLPAAFIAGFSARLIKKNKLLFFAGLALAVAVCYLFGTIWYAAYANVGFSKAFTVCVIPFIPLDLAKIITAGLLTLRLKKILYK